ncbi:hypothetical protein O181_074467, partial [Austropuccinia psidii MF-1]|nr:hypothetical protein [Austropuccinia psidii MF-1]
KTLLQHICRCSNLSVLLKSPSVPCEIKQLFESQPPALFNHHKYNKPSRHDQENYDCLVEYLQNFHATREIVDWISLDTTVQSTSHPASMIVSPWSHTYAPTPATAQAPAHENATATEPSPTTAKEPAHAHVTAQAPTHTQPHLPPPLPQGVPHVSPANGQCHLKLGPHMLCLCVHVSHPCTRFIVQWAPTMSPTHA